MARRYRTAAREGERGRLGSIGRVIADHVYYWTRDLERAVAFYTDVVGLPLVRRSGDEWAELDAGTIRIALHGTDLADPPASGTVVLRVPDLDAARWTLTERGAVFDEHVGEVEGYARFAMFRDPDGNPVQIIEYIGER
jgi:catechol 2,3-dioxygenase-like lactoylglutathione lyase family enzyme